MKHPLEKLLKFIIKVFISIVWLFYTFFRILYYIFWLAKRPPSLVYEQWISLNYTDNHKNGDPFNWSKHGSIFYKSYFHSIWEIGGKKKIETTEKYPEEKFELPKESKHYDDGAIYVYKFENGSRYSTTIRPEIYDTIYLEFFAMCKYMGIAYHKACKNRPHHILTAKPKSKNKPHAHNPTDLNAAPPENQYAG